jgi:hypothetical protein
MCKTCGTALSERIKLLSTKDPAVGVPNHYDGDPIACQGTAYKSYSPLASSLDERRPAPLEFVPQIWMNPDDVDAQIELVDNAERLGGCCGLSGQNGPNMRCRKCKAEVGTKQSDCFTPYIFVPDPQQTELQRCD